MRAIRETACPEVGLKVAPESGDLRLLHLPQTELAQAGRVDDPDPVRRGVEVTARRRVASFAVAFAHLADARIRVRNERRDQRAFPRARRSRQHRKAAAQLLAQRVESAFL